MQLTSAALAALLTFGGVAPAFAQGAGSKAPAPAASGAAKPLTEQQKKDAALKLFKDAEAKFDKGDCAGAVPLYREADATYPGQLPKYRIAVCHDKAGQLVDAAAGYQAFLDSKPDAKKHSDKIADAAKRIDEIKKTPAKVKVVTVPAAAPNMKISVDGVAQQSPELSLAPGKHQIALSADGYNPATQDVEVGFAETREVSVTLVAAAVPPPPVAAMPPPAPAEPPPAAAPAEPPAPPPEPSSPIPAYVCYGIAGAGLVVGTIFGIMALGAKSDYEADPTTDNLDAIDQKATIADIGFASAIGLGLAGTVFLLNSRPAEPAKAAAAHRGGHVLVAPYAGPTGAGAAARLTF